MAMKDLLMKTLFTFNSLDTDTRKQTYKHILRYIDVFNAVFENTTATLNLETITIEFDTNNLKC